MIYLGNNKLGEIYLGSTKIAQAYLGSTQIFSSTPVQYPYLLMEFTDGRWPTTSLLYSDYRNMCSWSQVSSSPNVWKLEIHSWGQPQEQMGQGIPVLFCSNVDGSTSYLANVPCKLVGGDLSIPIGGYYCQSMDRTFSNATGLTEISDIIQCTTLINTNGAFSGCTNCASGQYDLYSYLSTYNLGLTNHSGTFTDCGSNTQTGLDELDQIPTGWGGNMAPPASYMGGTRVKIYSNYDAWDLGNSHSSIFSNPYGLSLFTQVSVSSYAGVSMNRSRIKAINSLGTASGNALYFYPCFAQFSGTGSSARITWCYTTTGYNGMLTSSQGNTDMPGTLDYSTFGTFANEYGSYDSEGTVYFIFLVTNVPIANWSGLSDAYGVLYNSNFRNTDFWYFF